MARPARRVLQHRRPAHRRAALRPPPRTLQHEQRGEDAPPLEQRVAAQSPHPRRRAHALAPCRVGRTQAAARPAWHLLLPCRLHRRTAQAPRRAGEFRLGRQARRARRADGKLLRALDRPGPGPAHGELHLPPRSRRRRARVARRPANHGRVAAAGDHAREPAHHTERRAVLPAHHRVFFREAARDGEAQVEQSLHAARHHPRQPPLPAERPQRARPRRAPPRTRPRRRDVGRLLPRRAARLGGRYRAAIRRRAKGLLALHRQRRAHHLPKPLRPARRENRAGPRRHPAGERRLRGRRVQGLRTGPREDEFRPVRPEVLRRHLRSRRRHPARPRARHADLPHPRQRRLGVAREEVSDDRRGLDDGRRHVARLPRAGAGVDRVAAGQRHESLLHLAAPWPDLRPRRGHEDGRRRRARVEGQGRWRAHARCRRERQARPHGRRG